MLDTNLKNNDDLEMKNAGNENVTNGNVVKKIIIGKFWEL